MTRLRCWYELRLAAMLLVATVLTGCATTVGNSSPLVIEKQGAFAVGGKVLANADGTTLHCDHGMVDYQIPPKPRAVNLLMWHSASTVAWQNRWDGGEGYQSIFLRRGFPVYLWDGPRVGRANWACTELTLAPALGQDQRNFVSWRFGREYPNWYEGTQFPKDDTEALNQAMRGRYQEFDILDNVQLEAEAAAKLIDKIGPTVALTNSAAGFRAQLVATKTNNLKAIVAYESVGYVFPQGEGPGSKPSAFGPLEIPLEDFLKLTKIPIQIVWGDNVEKVATFKATLAQCKLFVEVVNKHGGHAELLMLTDLGLKGNTHLPFADMNNVVVADLLSKFLHAHGLDAYVH